MDIHLAEEDLKMHCIVKSVIDCVVTNIIVVILVSSSIQLKSNIDEFLSTPQIDDYHNHLIINMAERRFADDFTGRVVSTLAIMEEQRILIRRLEKFLNVCNANAKCKTCATQDGFGKITFNQTAYCEICDGIYCNKHGCKHISPSDL